MLLVFVYILGVLLITTPAWSIQQLSFSGGGAFGAVEIGILKKIRDSYLPRPDRLTGISAGGLNAGFLSHYADLDAGIAAAETLYSTIRNKDVYELVPATGNSLFNTRPLHNTLTRVLSNLTAEPATNTLIGAVNLYTGNLDIYSYSDTLSTEDRVLLLMSTSAIPIAFPPVKYKQYLYADGGTLSNELLDVVHSGDFLNITYITPYGLMAENDDPILTLRDMVIRTFQIVKKNYNNPFVRLDHQCKTPYGEIHYYYVDASALDGYSMLNFDKGSELVDIGYKHMKRMTYPLC